MQDVYNLAERFRRAIDIAIDNRELIMYPFYRFPDNCCDMTCDLLSQYFIENGIQTMHINGVHVDDCQWHHVWLQTMDGIVVDITADQFSERKKMPSDIPAVYVGGEGAIHKIFCKNRQIEGPTDFEKSICDSLGIPNKCKQDLFTAYTIIKRYL